ncbi:MAG: tetratricopeptide repeat protein [Coleofasciculus sp. A1-SPW-01]|uniref:O-linked N-acetylglucosamine transferase, SPINDLY family protein n=1 Tax=Coleofasciculus sp. A1-SPW-01 TaxID=3070819 RepID=UPI0032F4795F
MINDSSLTNSISWQQRANNYLIQGNYQKAANLYEQAIAAEPDVSSYYWYLGLMLLLQGQEAEAQMTWLLPMMQGDAEQVEQWTEELIQVLQTEAQRQEDLTNFAMAWAIRQHIREMRPADLTNLLHLINLAIKLERFTGDELTDLGIIDLLKSEQRVSLDIDLLLQLLQKVLDKAPLHPSSLELAKACLPHIQEPIPFLLVLVPASIEIAYTVGLPGLAAELIALGLPLNTYKAEILRHLAAFYQNSRNYVKGIETAKWCYAESQTLPEKVGALYLLMRGLLTTGAYWDEVWQTFDQQQSLLLALIEEQSLLSNPALIQRLFNVNSLCYYLQDEPQKNRQIQNQVAQLAQINVQNYAKEQAERYRQRSVANRTKPLKIGYLSHCFRSHSVGWLARWVFQHHNPDCCQVYTYFISYKERNDPLQEWYFQQADQAYKGGGDGTEIAEKIYQDEIDILIDLDSITLDTTCEILSLKPAPIQVTWLGWDASGIPAIDYFIADPYVLPDSAQTYYSEKIWRLPQTYIAVEGFEVDVPTLRRDQLEIPSDAMVYLSAQNGYKRHPHTVRLQMKILREVPNSYFLVKGFADEEAIQKLFSQIAEEEGVNSDRLRFLPMVASEAVHRANLGIADVILDTYPYNGATTTLEALWMGIPLVTRVGEQFASRNSYTMLVNAGVTAGIAWTDEEYVEWGVRLGTDAALRQEVAMQLWRSRQTAPLWNARQFTRELEAAYEQMWTRYLDSRHSL